MARRLYKKNRATGNGTVYKARTSYWAFV